MRDSEREEFMCVCALFHSLRYRLIQSTLHRETFSPTSDVKSSPTLSPILPCKVPQQESVE